MGISSIFGLKTTKILVIRFSAKQLEKLERSKSGLMKLLISKQKLHPQQLKPKTWTKVIVDFYKTTKATHFQVKNGNLLEGLLHIEKLKSFETK